MSTPPCPFKVGDRIRLRQGFGRKGETRKAKVCSLGVYVTPGYIGNSDYWNDGGWYAKAHRDGRKFPATIRCREWELDTDPEILRDATADQLIKAYQDGDKTALRPLVDRLLEILQEVYV